MIRIFQHFDTCRFKFLNVSLISIYAPRWRENLEPGQLTEKHQANHGTFSLFNLDLQSN